MYGINGCLPADGARRYGMNQMVSVIITTHDRTEFLKRAIASARSQTYQDIEIIVVDDASSEHLGDFIKGLNDPRVLYVRRDECMGAPESRNEGIRRSRGEYIAFLDDDDEWFPEKTRRQVEKMRSCPANVGVVYSGVEIIEDDTGKARKSGQLYRGDLGGKLLEGSTIGSVSKVLVKKECFDRAGLFDAELTSCQDWDMWKRISAYYEFDYVEDVLVRIHMHGRQISTDLGAMISGRTRMLGKHMEELYKHPDILIDRLKRLGKLHFFNGTYGKGLAWFWRAIRIRPLETFKVLAWVMVEFPRVMFFSRVRDFKKAEDE